ncbi:signal peptidase I [Paenibacillus sp. CAA11]|uniref:signal peptidase I SipW n=1 Tax=Paenibacillus sp. CAA11 TaxID=1532905 RepID=UPI000D3440DB|nr:signal peptidase I [Paenibacillus sp. CAA11]AWB45859.1 signal peptidase I [Paenibacillus sp. CAA11]
MRIRKIVSTLLSSVLLLLFMLMAVSVIFSRASGGQPSFFGLQIKTVLSGSMEPGIRTGSIIAVKPGGDMTRFQEGDIITFRSHDKLVTHRIIEVVKNGQSQQVMYRTKGDHNDAPDLEAVPSGSVIGEYNGFTLPYVGYAMSFASSKAGSVVLLVIPGILLIIYSFVSCWRALSTIEKREPSGQSPADSV